ncbi:MAG: hypothetical protein D6741_15980, partial [Planctomycetota bacterium]
MKTTARILTSVIAVGVGVLLVASQLNAQVVPGSTGNQGQTPDQLRQRSDDLLARARQAIAENDLDAAERLVREAEALGVTYPPVYLGDTPAKVRRAIEQARGGSGLNRLLSGFKNDPKVPDATPFDAAGAGGVTPLPPVGQVRPVTPPGAAGDAAKRANSDRWLLEARRALAVGDVRTARKYVEQVKSLGLQYGRYDDSPERVTALIDAYEKLTADKATKGGTEAYRRLYAKVLLEQADGLLRWGDLDEAERLTMLAQQQNVTFSAFEVKPESLLKRIQQERAGKTGVAQDGRKQTVARLVQQARAALAQGDVTTAEVLAGQAMSMNVPDSAFSPNEDRPSLVWNDIQRAKTASGVVPAAAQQVVPASGAYPQAGQAAPAVYNPNNDPTWNRLAGAQQPMGMGMTLVRQAEDAIRRGDQAGALRFFQQAMAYRNELDPVTAQRVQDYLAQHTARPTAYNQPSGYGGEEFDPQAQQDLLVRQMVADLAHQEATAMSLRDKDPQRALSILQDFRNRIASSGLDTGSRDQLLRRVDKRISELQQYIEQNAPKLDLLEKNRRIEDEIAQEQKAKIEIDQKLADMVNEYNQLMREQRFAEAEVIAKRAAEMYPDNPVTSQLVLNARFIRQFAANQELKAQKEQGFLDALASVDRASTPFDDSTPYVMPNAVEWETVTAARRKQIERTNRRLNEKELQIERQLDFQVMLDFDNTPLANVTTYLARLTGINIHLDPQGLAAEGVTTDTPVSISLTQEVSLRSALNLILEPLNLSYVIKDDVLKITSRQYCDNEMYVEVYSVADLVTPIPNFNGYESRGLEAAMDTAYRRIDGRSGVAGVTPGTTVLAGNGVAGSGVINPAVLAQMSSSIPPGSGTPAIPPMQGTGAQGGAALADFDSLINLIQSTIAPTTWDALGGQGSIQPFPTNLSLVVSNTQEVHEEIADLLEQLRRMHDLQVTVEVRFITLNDNFFERIGVDFDFDIDDKIDGRRGVQWGQIVDPGDPADPDSPPVRNIHDLDQGKNITVGMSAPNTFSADLDIPFRQGSFALAVPQFGGYDPTAGAQIGFAILSEIEAFFFIEAAQADRRSNVLQAPKVTLYNGQLATIADQSQSPFVTSVRPIVGDFAAAQEPVIVVLSEGTFLTVQAVVSEDRRFVRLTVVPFFSTIGDVNEFTFVG